jgi:putative tryptophan/tyrosine transport system substrate-binding protein
MRRRDFITLLGGGAAAWPLTARAQQSDRVRRLGVVTTYAESDATARRWVATLVTGLRELGWTAGDNIQIEYRWPGADVGRINSATAELVGLKPDVIVATGPLTVTALQRLTSTIPIVFQGIADPVATGIVASLARPGGNITGFGLGEFSISGKMLEYLKRIAPNVRHVGVIYNPAQVPQVGRLATIQALGPSLDVQVTAYQVSSADQIAAVIEGFTGSADGGFVVLPSPITIANRELIIGLMARHHLPTVYEYPDFAREGGLVSYGSDPAAHYHQLASYVDRILKGAAPADLPIQQPTKFILAINLKTANALGLTVPPGLLAGADEVIE